MSTFKRIIIVAALAAIALTPQAIAQDLGAPDSLIMIPSELDASCNDSLFTIELWAFNDSNINVQVQFGFKWNSNELTLENAILGPNLNWNIAIFYDGTIERSNANDRANFQTIDFSGWGLPPTPDRILLATYYFTVSGWSVHSAILIDSAAWDNGSEMFFCTPAGDCYEPVWSAGDAYIGVWDVSQNPYRSCCGVYTCGQTGNIDCDPAGERNIADLTRLIDRIFLTKTDLCCEANGNVDGDLATKMNLSDITSLIDHIYLSKAETALCE